MIEGAVWRKWVFYNIPLILFVFVLLFPFYWMIITSFRPDGELYRPRQSRAHDVELRAARGAHRLDELPALGGQHWTVGVGVAPIRRFVQVGIRRAGLRENVLVVPAIRP